VLVYISINVSLIRVMTTRFRSEFTPLRHAVLPVIGSVVMGGALVGNLYPVPASPFKWFPYVVLGLLAAGTAFFVWLTQAKPEKVANAGAILAGDEPTVTALVEVEPLAAAAPAR
jgi:hypothetical protein